MPCSSELNRTNNENRTISKTMVIGNTGRNNIRMILLKTLLCIPFIRSLHCQVGTMSQFKMHVAKLTFGWTQGQTTEKGHLFWTHHLSLLGHLLDLVDELPLLVLQALPLPFNIPDGLLQHPLILPQQLCHYPRWWENHANYEDRINEQLNMPN